MYIYISLSAVVLNSRDWWKIVWLPENFALQKSTNLAIKTHDSESRGQEEAGRTRRTSELFTRSTALKFVNALNKPP